MITRREKLLIRPWEQRRYENHRRKVHSAVHAIDVSCPPDREHVICKLKKQQKETERCDKIENDNLKLLQRLKKIMKTSRVDNTWTNAQPSFLNRVEIYSSKTKLDRLSRSLSETPDIQQKNRKERCGACTPKKSRGPVIPEERIPWDPPKEPVARKRSQSLPPKILPENKSTKNEKPQKTKDNKEKIHSAPKNRSRSRPISKKFPQESSQSIVLSRGDLHLSVNFPLDTVVKIKDNHSEKLIFQKDCQCTAIKSH